MASYTYTEHFSGCKCCRLEHGDDLPIPKDLSYEETSALATKFSHSIFADWTQLNAILKRFEGVIQKRWTKKGSKQRRDILLKACPDMPADHRPDFASFRNTRHRNQPRSSTLISAAYLWPYINLEDLQKHHILLLFLNARGRNSPSVFLHADVLAAHLGRGWGFDADFAKGPTEDTASMHFDFSSPRSYGRLVRDNERPFYDAYRNKEFSLIEAVALWDQHLDYYHPKLGLLALEIQNHIYSFLVTCAKCILHDMESKDFLLAPFTVSPAPLVSPTHDWPSLTAHQLESTYCVPQKLDLDRVKMLVASRRASAEDHLWLLKEDPAYFASTYEEWAQHDYAMLFHYCSDCVQRVVALMTSNAINSFVLWDYVHRGFEKLSTPTKDHYTWAAVLWVLEEVQELTLHELKAIQSSPRTRHIYKVMNLPEDQRMKKWKGFRLQEFEHRAMTLFNNLCDREHRNTHPLHELVEEMQYMLDTDAKAAQLVDSYITGHFSDLALATELKYRIEGLRPWAAKWKANGFRNVPQVKSSNEKILELIRSVKTDIVDMCKEEKNFIGDPSDSRFHYPVSKAYTKSNVDQLRLAEGLLDKFWQDLEVGVAKRNGLSLEKVMHSRFLEPRTLYRTQEWTPPALPPVKATVLTRVDTNVPQFHDTCQASTKFEVVKPKEKIKTRGVASPTTQEARPGADDFAETDDSALQQINVPKRTYRVLSALFPKPSAENHQRVEVAWFDFLHAMNAIGLQPEKLYGSVWIFRPKKDALIEGKRSIQFHEPKEIRHGGKIPATFVRVFGRRLKRVYGWDADTFGSK